MPFNFPVFNDVKNTLFSWQKTLTNLSRFEESLGPTFAWTDWSPTYSTSGTMTFAVTALAYARYIQLGEMLWFRVDATGTTGGVASTGITFTLPPGITHTSTPTTAPEALASRIVDGGGGLAGIGYAIGGNRIGVLRYDGAVWGIGTNRRIIVNGFIEVIP